MKTRLLTVISIACASMGAWAATMISTPAEFVSALTSSPAGAYVLANDIDLTGSGYVSIAGFSGTLDGAGHTITGLGAQPLFLTNLSSSAVANLTVDGTVAGTNTVRVQSGAGVICDVAQGATFTDCIVKGYTLHHSVSGYEGRWVQNGIGLIAGGVSGNARFERCMADASCRLYQRTSDGLECYAKSLGGIVGVVTLSGGWSPELIEFIDCTNKAPIMAAYNHFLGASGSGGIVGTVQRASGGSENKTARFVGCFNFGAIDNLQDNLETITLGGIVGAVGVGDSAYSARIEFDDCVNFGQVGGMHRGAYGSGGILGWHQQKFSIQMQGCVNRADIGGTAVVNVGGLIGGTRRAPPTPGAFLMVNCANYGTLTGKAVGGLLGKIDGSNFSTSDFAFRNSANHGARTASANTGEIFGELVAVNADGTANTNYNPTVVIDNCWTPATSLYGSSLVTPTVTNCWNASQSDATAVENLETVARGNENYALWKIGPTTHPEIVVLGAGVAVVFSDVAVTQAEDGAEATLTVSIVRSTITTGTLVLKINGQVRQTWDLNIGTFTTTINVLRGRVYGYEFVASGLQLDDPASDVIAGSFQATAMVGWFDVRFADAGYVPGANWIVDSHDASGGTWTASAAGATLDGATRTVSFAPGSAAVLDYQPSRRSEPDADVRVTGRIQADVTDKLKRPADAPFALAFEPGSSPQVCLPVVCVNGTWTRFGTTGVATGSWTDFTVEVDHASADAPRVRATVGAETSDWLPITVARRSVSSVGFAGGAFDDFNGVFFSRIRADGTLIIVR